MDMRNHDLKEDIREYWSKRFATFDLAYGHRIPPGPELEAWAAAVRNAIGPEPCSVLELACGTGEVTNVLLLLGHEVTALDFSEAMLNVARTKHVGNARVNDINALVLTVPIPCFHENEAAVRIPSRPPLAHTVGGSILSRSEARAAL